MAATDQTATVIRVTESKRFGRRRQEQLLKILLTFSFAVLAVIFIIPFYWMFVSSIRPADRIFVEATQFWPSEVTFDSYINLFQQAPYVRWYINSIVMSVGSAALSILLCTMAAFPLAKYRFPYRNAIFLTILGSQMVPFHLMLIPLFLILVGSATIDTFWGVVVPIAAHPFGVFYMRQYMLGISADILDAGRVDGASEYRLFWSIVLPLVKPALGALMILFSMQFWNDLLWPLIVMRTTEKLPLAVGIATLLNSYRPQYDLLMSASFLASFPIIFVFLFVQKQFITGMSATGMVVEK